MDHDSQIVRAKENLKLSYGERSHGQLSGTNERINLKLYVRAAIESEARPIDGKFDIATSNGLGGNVAISNFAGT